MAYQLTNETPQLISYSSCRLISQLILLLNFPKCFCVGEFPFFANVRVLRKIIVSF